MRPKPVQISHDPFARHALMRERIPLRYRFLYCKEHDQYRALYCEECKECGRHARFRYFISGDDRPTPHTSTHDQAFCSISCYRTYNG